MSPTTITSLRITTVLALLEKIRKAGKSKELGIEHYFHTGKTLHAQEQPLAQKGWLYSCGNSFGMEETSPSPVFSTAAD